VQPPLPHDLRFVPTSALIAKWHTILNVAAVQTVEHRLAGETAQGYSEVLGYNHDSCIVTPRLFSLEDYHLASRPSHLPSHVQVN
jgi:hypothetical protein